MKKILFLALFLNSPVFAVFDVQGMLGYRMAEFKGHMKDSTPSKTTAMPYTAALHISPLPLIPLSVGGTVSYMSFDVSSGKHGFENFGGPALGFEVVGWVPYIPIPFTPYAKLGYELAFFSGKPTARAMVDQAAKVAATVSDIDLATLTQSGYLNKGVYFGVGVKFSIIPMFSAFVEYDMGFTSVEETSIAKEAGVGEALAKVIGESFEKQDFHYHAFHIGLEYSL